MEKDKNLCIKECGDTVIKEVKESEEHRLGWVEVCNSCNKVLGYLSSPKKKDPNPPK